MSVDVRRMSVPCPCVGCPTSQTRGDHPPLPTTASETEGDFFGREERATRLSAEPTYPTEVTVHDAIDRMDALSFALRESLETAAVGAPSACQQVIVSMVLLPAARSTRNAAGRHTAWLGGGSCSPGAARA